MQVKTKAIVIHSIKYGEANLIAKCYTESDGLKSYMLRGILKSKKGKLKASFFQPFTLLELDASHKNKGSLEYIKEAKPYMPNHYIGGNVFKTSVAIFLAEVLLMAIQEEEKNTQLFNFLETEIIQLTEIESIGNWHLLFLLNLTQYLGFYPDQQQEGMIFNLLEGSFQPETTNAYCLENKASVILKQFLNLSNEESLIFKLNHTSRKAFIDLMMQYYGLHLQGFREPKSLAVMEELFQ